LVRAAPDGYTLGFNNTGILINPLLRNDVSFDPLKDMVPIGPVAEAPMLLAINGELPAKSLQEFIALAKASPGKFNYASAGPGSTQHLASARFAQLAGVDIVHVPYRGTPQAITDLVQGGVQMVSISLGPVAGFLENKRIRVLAAATERRIGSLPDIPTSEEAGLPGYTMTTWFGLFAPRGTPNSIVHQLNGYISEMHQTDEVRKVLAANSIEPMQMSPDRFKIFLEKDMAGWENVVRESGVQLK
jgi:tripartite-type tricarboxylate transporter receptor subunit TctC